jgi:hypothetical protein
MVTQRGNGHATYLGVFAGEIIPGNHRLDLIAQLPIARTLIFDRSHVGLPLGKAFRGKALLFQSQLRF